SLPREGGTVGQVAFGPAPADPKYLYIVATAEANGSAVVRQVGTSKVIRLDSGGTNLFGVAFANPSSHLTLLTTSLNGVVGSWNIDGEEELRLDRDELLAKGFERISSMTLDEVDCKMLKEMQIPAFSAMKDNSDSNETCPLQYLNSF